VKLPLKNNPHKILIFPHYFLVPVYCIASRLRIYPNVFRAELILMITLKEAKNILGNYGKELNDKQIQAILNFLYGLCEKVIDMEVKNKIYCCKALKSYN